MWGQALGWAQATQGVGLDLSLKKQAKNGAPTTRVFSGHVSQPVVLLLRFLGGQEAKHKNKKHVFCVCDFSHNVVFHLCFVTKLSFFVTHGFTLIKLRFSQVEPLVS